MKRSHQRKSHPLDKMVPIERIRGCRKVVWEMWIDQHWVKEDVEIKSSTVGQVVKKMHNRKQRQYNKTLEKVRAGGVMETQLSPKQQDSGSNPDQPVILGL